MLLKVTMSKWAFCCGHFCLTLTHGVCKTMQMGMQCCILFVPLRSQYFQCIQISNTNVNSKLGTQAHMNLTINFV